MLSPIVDIVLPVHNEQNDLGSYVRQLHTHLGSGLSHPFQITVVDNTSTGTTLAVATALAAEFPSVRVVHLPGKGREYALRAVWSASTAPVLACMDVDRLTDLAAVVHMVEPLVSGESDLAIGSRQGSRATRGAKRDLRARSYNLILRHTLSSRFSDATCGVKAIRREVAIHLLPLVKDNGSFFDIELLVLAERSGLRINEVPLDWVDSPDSHGRITRTVLADLRGIARLARAFASGRLPVHDLRQQLGGASRELATTHVPAGLTRQAVRFAAVGVASTLANLGLFLLLRKPLGAQAANALGLLLTAIANTALNRRFTFGVTGRQQITRHQLQGLIVFGLALGLTSGALALTHAINSAPPASVELAVIVAANAAATLIRFLLLRHWVFRPGRPLR